MTTCRIRRAPSCSQQVERLQGARLSRLFRLRAGILPVQRDLQLRPRQALAEPRHRLALYRRLPDRHHHQGRGRDAPAPQRDGSAPASRSRTPRARWGPGQEEINVRYAEALEMADRHVILKNGAKEIAAPGRQGDHLHGEVQLRRWPAIPATSTIRCGAPTARRRCSSTRRPTGRCRRSVQQWVGRPAQIRQGVHLVPGALHQFLQALPGRHLRADQDHVEPRTTAPPASGCAARAPRASAWNAASAAPTSTPISPSRR